MSFSRRDLLKLSAALPFLVQARAEQIPSLILFRACLR